MDLRERVVVLTGGAGHLGSAMADALAELGATVVLVDSAGRAATDVASAIGRDRGVVTHVIVANMEDEEQARAVPEQVLAVFGRLDVLVNAAALVGTSALPGWSVPFEQQHSTTWRRALEVNLTAAFVLAQACAPPLRHSGHGAIVNVASIYGMVGPDARLYEDTAMGNAAAYAASKGGLLQLTRWLATTLAPEIRVNAITPGGVRRDQPGEFRRRYEQRTPLGRMSVEEDVKGAVAYLASDLSAYVTGHNLVVDGGWTAW